MKKIIFIFLALCCLACNNGTENNAESGTTTPDSSLHMEDGTVNADTIDKRTDARMDKD